VVVAYQRKSGFGERADKRLWSPFYKRQAQGGLDMAGQAN
jgi:hypothetical protein